MINSVLLEAFNEVFKSLGSRKKSANWYRVSGDLYCIVGVQESHWDESCYVNVGFTPAANVKAGWLPESKCLVDSGRTQSPLFPAKISTFYPEKQRRRVERMTFEWASSRRLQIQRRGRSIRLRICRI